MEEQQFNLRSGAEIIIATPGRLKDVIERHVIVLSQCRYIVMDEADRMVNLGFEADLTFILDKLPSDTMEGEDQGEQMDIDGETLVKKGRTRVTTLFSATMPPPVERLAKKYLKRPAIITIGEAGRAVDTVEQKVEFVIGDERKKYTFSAMYPGPFLISSSQAADARNSQQWPIWLADHRLRQPKEDCRHGRQRSPARRSTYYSAHRTDKLLTAYLTVVERGHSAFRKESRTARSRVAVFTFRRVRYPRRYRSGGAWYRCSGRPAGHQLPNVEHNRSLCAPYWYVSNLRRLEEKL